MADDSGSPINSAPKLLRSQATGPRAFHTLWFLPLGCLAAVVLWAYWPTFDGILGSWLSDPDYTHGFFVIPISLWLLWLRREHAPRATLQIDWRGLLLLFTAGAIRCASGRLHVPQFDAWSIPIWLGGIVWLLFGWQMIRWAWPAIAFLWFATPLPGTVEVLLSTPLQRLAAGLSAWVLRLIGQPAMAQGTIILVGDKPLDVEHACSGLRMFYGIFALAVACIVIARPPKWKSVLVLFIAAPVAIIANVIRVAATAMLLKFASTDAAQHFSHDLAGIVMIPLAVTLFLVFLVLIGHVIDRMKDPRGVAWVIKWCVAGTIVASIIILWGQHQSRRAISTLLETAVRNESQGDLSRAIQYYNLYIQAAPDDLDTYTHLARLYQAHAKGIQDKTRALELLQQAWKNQPQNEDLAISAIETALQIQDFDDAIPLTATLISRSTQPKMRSQAVKLRAEAIYQYLLSDKKSGDYTWNHAKEAFEAELKLPDYEISDALALANIYRNPKTNVPSEQREKLATSLINRVVTERSNDPTAWLARFLYRANQPTTADLAKAEDDLKHAIDLASKQVGNHASAQVLIAAASYKGNRNDLKSADSLLRRAIEIAPDNAVAYLQLADVIDASRTNSATDDAIAILKKGLERTNVADLSQRWQLQLRLASLLIKKGSLSDAETLIAPIERDLPHVVSGAAPLRLELGIVHGQLLLKRDGPFAAKNYLSDVLEDSDTLQVADQIPDLVAKGYAFLGQTYVALGLTDLAIDSFQQAAHYQPNVPEWQFQAAALAQQSGDLESANHEFRALVQSGRASGDVQAAAAEVEIKRQLQLPTQERDWSAAKRMLQIALQSGGSPVTIRLLAAELLAASGESDKADQSILKLTEEFPKEPAPWRALVITRFQRHDITGALQAADQFAAVARQPIDSAALTSGLLIATGKPDKARQLMTAAFEKATAADLPKAALALSQLLAQLGKPDEAHTILETAHAKSPKDLQVVDSLANSAFVAQDWKALEKYESWLAEIEGNSGTMWKAYRAQRLLAKSESTDDKNFQQAAADVDAVLAARPHWSKSHYLRGEIDFRLNRIDAAVQDYERAWQLGGRGILLTDRLVDLLSRQGRYESVRQYVIQARDYLPVSQGLFDRAVPYLIQGSEGQEMARVAREWAKQRPDDAEAHLRLGRVLLMASNSATGIERQTEIDEAKTELRRAIDLKPADVRPWAAAVLLFNESPATRGDALKLLEEFAKQPRVDELERDFILAQLYEQLGLMSGAQHYYNVCAARIDADPKTVGGARVLGRLARFYLRSVPSLSEQYARRALAQDAANLDARLSLLFLLANSDRSGSADEALRILDDPKSKQLLDADVVKHYRATFLARRAKPGDLNSAIELLAGAGISREDKLLLARLYEQSGQAPAALELLQSLVRSSNANAVELVEFLRFWQQHFFATAVGKEPIQFAGLANDVYERLGELPNQLPERLRWRLREISARKSAGPPGKAASLSVVSEVLNSQTAKSLTDIQKKQFMQLALVVLLQENHEDCVAQLVTSPPPGFPAEDMAIWLCHAYVIVPTTKEIDARKKLLSQLLTTHAKTPTVLQSIGDCLFMASEYELAADAYKKSLEVRPDERMARNDLALALVELQKPQEARQVLAQALKSHADDIDLLDTQAVLDIIDKHSDRAIPVFEKLVSNNPENAVLRFHLAVAYDDMKNSDRARDSILAASALGIEQRILSPRDKKSLEVLRSRYLSSESGTIGKSATSNSTQASN